MHGELITRIAAGRPLAIGVDLIFDRPSSRGPADDEALGAAIAMAGNVILGAAVAEDVQPVPGLGIVYERATLNQPIDVIRRGAAGVAPVNMTADPDGEIRRAIVETRLAEESIPGFDAQLHALTRHVRAPVETRLIPSARHAPHLEAPEPTLSAITQFVATCLRKAAA